MSIEFPPEIEALALAVLAKRVKERTDLVKATVGGGYPDGHKETFRSPLDGAKLGLVWRTDPDPRWTVTDREALHAHLREFPGAVETVHELADIGQATAYLYDHAPHLLVEITRVTQEAVDAALAQSQATGQPAAPGISLVKPGGTLTVKPDAGAAGVVERMVQAGLLTWDGRPVLEQGEVAS